MRPTKPVDPPLFAKILFVHGEHSTHADSLHLIASRGAGVISTRTSMNYNRTIKPLSMSARSKSSRCRTWMSWRWRMTSDRVLTFNSMRPSPINTFIRNKDALSSVHGYSQDIHLTRDHIYSVRQRSMLSRALTKAMIP